MPLIYNGAFRALTEDELRTVVAHVKLHTTQCSCFTALRRAYSVVL